MKSSNGEFQELHSKNAALFVVDKMEPYWKTFFWNWQICVEDVKITIGEATLKLVRFTQYASSFRYR